MAKRKRGVAFDEENDPQAPSKLPKTVDINDELKNVQTRVSKIEKNLDVEFAARKELYATVEVLKAERSKAKERMAEAEAQASNEILDLLRALPCKSLNEVDALLIYVENNSLQWVCILLKSVILTSGRGPCIFINVVVSIHIYRRITSNFWVVQTTTVP